MEEKKTYYKIPLKQVKSETNEVDDKLHIIGVIDSSGSMSSWWKWIAEFWNSDAIPKKNLHTITFDTRQYVCETNILSTKINHHGGGGTAIPEAFKKFEEILETIPVGETVTAIFISDGDDNHQNTLEARMNTLKGNNGVRKINFICLGIQSGFPTFLSMRLRQLYHCGDENIPALYLIEYVSEKAFFNKFEGMKQYFYNASSISIDPAVMVYPWDESVVSSAYEGSWVICKSTELTLDEAYTVKIEKQNLSIEDAVEIFRGWIQKLQMVSLNDSKNAKDYAKIAVSEMEIIINELNKTYAVEDVRTITQELAQSQQNFGLRAKYNYIWRYGSKIDWFFNEIKNLSLGVSPKQESEFEAAKRMNIGTITGKHQQKALALKNITQSEFNKIKEEFVTILNSLRNKIPSEEMMNDDAEKNKINAVNKKMMNLFINIDDFIEGLSYCKNQYDLCETLPLTGIATLVKRQEGSLENQKLVYFKRIFLGQSTDIATLTNCQWNIPIISEGESKTETKQPEEKEEAKEQKPKKHEPKKEKEGAEESKQNTINGLLLLFKQSQTAFIKPILKSRLMKFLMSYSLTQNFDLIFDDSYQFILSSALIQAYQNSNLEERRQVCNLIFESLQMLFDEDKNFQITQDKLYSDPNTLIIEQKDNIEHLFLHLFYAKMSKRLNNQQLEDLFIKLKTLFFHVVVQKCGLLRLVKPDFMTLGIQNIINQMREKSLSYFSISELRKKFCQNFLEFAIKSASESLRISKKIIYDEEICNVPLRLIENLIQDSADANNQVESEKNEQQIKDLHHEYILLIAHVNKHPLGEVFSNPISQDLEYVKQIVIEKLDHKIVSKNKGYKEIFEAIEKEYVQKFVETHWNIKPLKKEELITYCQQNNIVFDTLEFDESSLLCKNACMSPLCPFFLKPAERFNRHMGAWQGKMPLGFHRFIKSRVGSTPNEIYELATNRWKGFPSKFNSTKEFALEYISKTLASYGEIKQ